MIEDIEDIEFERLLADKKHKELMAAIKQLIISIKNDDTKDAEILNSINSNNKALNTFLSKLNELVKPDTKEAVINVETNQKEVVKEAQNIIENQKRIIQLLEKRPTRLKVIRGYDNRIDFVDVSYDQINKK